MKTITCLITSWLSSLHNSCVLTLELYMKQKVYCTPQSRWFLFAWCSTCSHHWFKHNFQRMTICTTHNYPQVILQYKKDHMWQQSPADLSVIDTSSCLTPFTSLSIILRFFCWKDLKYDDVMLMWVCIDIRSDLSVCILYTSNKGSERGGERERKKLQRH